MINKEPIPIYKFGSGTYEEISRMEFYESRLANSAYLFVTKDVIWITVFKDEEAAKRILQIFNWMYVSEYNDNRVYNLIPALEV